MITDSHNTTDSHIHRDLIDQVMNSVPAMHFGADALLRLISIEEIENQMEAFYTYEENGRPKLMEIFTPSDLNHIVLDDFFEKTK